MAKTAKKRTVASVIVAQRAPHLATAEVVELFGNEIAKELYQAFHRMNEEHFESQLGAPLVLITQPSAARSLADYCSRDVHGLESRIRIAPRVFDQKAHRWGGMLFAVDCLLHEMVHAWQTEIDEDTEDGYRGHGPRFAKKCNEIGARLGLPPVGVKKRDGLPDCSYWPYIVRPADYYPAPFEAPKRRKNGESDGEESEGSEKAEKPAESTRAKLTKIMRLVRKLSRPELGEFVQLLATELKIQGEDSAQAEAAE